VKKKDYAIDQKNKEILEKNNIICKKDNEILNYKMFEDLQKVKYTNIISQKEQEYNTFVKKSKFNFEKQKEIYDNLLNKIKNDVFLKEMENKIKTMETKIIRLETEYEENKNNITTQEYKNKLKCIYTFEQSFLEKYCNTINDTNIYNTLKFMKIYMKNTRNRNREIIQNVLFFQENILYQKK